MGGYERQRLKCDGGAAKNAEGHILMKAVGGYWRRSLKQGGIDSWGDEDLPEPLAVQIDEPVEV